VMKLGRIKTERSEDLMSRIKWNFPIDLCGGTSAQVLLRRVMVKFSFLSVCVDPLKLKNKNEDLT
jgi:hypothetical protein